METRPLGPSGLALSVLGLGCNTFSYSLDQEATNAVVGACLDEGVVFFDTADYYGDSEVFLGKALAGRRHQAIVATKFGNDLQGRLATGTAARGSARYIQAAVDASLTRLGTDVIDLYQQHVPDPSTPVEETIGALTELRRQGKIRAFGCSNLAPGALADSLDLSQELGLDRWACTQDRYNLLERQAATTVVPVCQAYGLGLIAYFPLANGLLSGKYRRELAPPPGARLTEQSVPWRTRAGTGLDLLTDETFDRLDPLFAFADQRGLTLLDLALGGLAVQPGVTCLIAGATRPDQVRANAAAVRWQPTPDDLVELDRACGVG